MHAVVRTIPRITLALLLGGLIAACGDTRPAHEPKGRPGFVSKAGTPTGAPIKIRYGIQEGEGLRMTVRMSGSTNAEVDGESHEIPMDMSVVSLMRCTERGEDGGYTMRLTYESMSMPGAMGQAGGNPTEGLEGTMRIGPDGKVESVSFEGGDPQMEQMLSKMFQGGGFATSMPFPPEGMRVGEALDIAKIMPSEALNQMFSSIPGMSPGAMDLQGKYVLVGTKTVDGKEAAEFAINAVMTMDVDMNEVGNMSNHVTMSGTQYIDLRTGLPVGTSTLLQKMTMKMDMEVQGERKQMETAMDMTMEMVAEHLEAK